MFFFISNLFHTVTPVKTPHQAQIIGEKIAHERFPKVNYNNYRLSVADGDNKPYIMGGVWCVYYSPINKNGELAEVLGGGGPEIHIRKKDGKIIYANLQR